MDMKVDHIIWTTTEYRMKYILDNPNFGLPQIVRVVTGYMHDEDDCLASGQILTLHGRKTIEKLNGRDAHGKEVNIPVNCPYKVKLLAVGNKRVFKSIRDICKCENLPEAIRNSGIMSTGSGTCYPSGTRLLVRKRLKSDIEQPIGLECEVASTGEPVHLPLDFASSFEEDLPDEVLTRRFFVWEVVKEYGLPIEVQFLPVTDRVSGYGPNLGTIRVEKVLSSDVVMATSVLDKVRYAMTFSADLPVTIQVAKGMMDHLTTYEETRLKEHQGVDLSKFENLTLTNPYAPVLFQNEVYDKLKTPVPRRKLRPPQRDSSLDANKLPQRKIPMPELRRSKTEDFIRIPTKFREIRELESFVREKLNLKPPSTKPKLKREKAIITNVEYSPIRTSPRRSPVPRRTAMTPSPRKEVRLHGLEKRPSSSRSGSGSIGACSIDYNSNGSACNEPHQRIIQYMDAASLNDVAIEPSRRSSSDSGVCLPAGKRRSPHRHKHRRYMTDQSDKASEWSLPVNLHARAEAPSIRKNSPTTGSINVLWGTGEPFHEQNQKIDENNNVEEEQETKRRANSLNIPECIVDDASNDSRDHFLETSFSSCSDNSSKIDAEIHTSPSEMRIQASMAEIRGLNEEGVVNVLSLLKLSEFSQLFRENQINGELLINLDVADFVSELKLSFLQARKLYKYIHGWRPCDLKEKEETTSRRSSLNPRDWTDDDVVLHMNSINLSDFAAFCKHNQINGELLLDILDNDTLQSLRIDHHVKISNLESKKLLNFVVKGWRPDGSTGKSSPV